jgi:hypothetical protein
MAKLKVCSRASGSQAARYRQSIFLVIILLTSTITIVTII